MARRNASEAAETIKTLQQQLLERDGIVEDCEEEIPSMPSTDIETMSEEELLAEWERTSAHHELLKEKIQELLTRLKVGNSSESISRGGCLDVPRLPLLGPSDECGLTWDRRWEGESFGPAEEAARDGVRYGTREKVVKELGLAKWGSPAITASKYPPYASANEMMLFVDASAEAKEGSAPAGGRNLLGRYEMVCVRARADFDRHWNLIRGDKRSFWVLHTAAINIGESQRAADYPDFSLRDGTLDGNRYVTAMGHICANIVKVCTALRIEHLVFFPFGMGAFLRHLPLLDPRYSDAM